MGPDVPGGLDLLTGGDEEREDLSVEQSMDRAMVQCNHYVT